MELAEKIKLLMESHCLTQAQLAKKTGVSQNTIFKITSGATKNSRHYPAIAKVFNMTTEELLSIEVPDEPKESPAKRRLLRKVKDADADETTLAEIEQAVDAILKASEVKKKLGI